MDPRARAQKLKDVLKTAQAYKRDFEKDAKEHPFTRYSEFKSFQELIKLHRDFIEGVAVPAQQIPEAKAAIEKSEKDFNAIFQSIFKSQGGLEISRQLHQKYTDEQISKAANESEKLKIFAAEIIALTSTVPTFTRLEKLRVTPEGEADIADHKLYIQRRANDIFSLIKDYKPTKEDEHAFNLIKQMGQPIRDAEKQQELEDKRKEAEKEKRRQEASKRHRQDSKRTDVEGMLKALTSLKEQADACLYNMGLEAGKANPNPRFIFDDQESLRELVNRSKDIHASLPALLAETGYSSGKQSDLLEQSQKALTYIEKQYAEGLKKSAVDDKTRELKETSKKIEAHCEEIGAAMRAVHDECKDKKNLDVIKDGIMKGYAAHAEVQKLYVRAQGIYGSDGKAIQSADAARSVNDFYMLEIRKSSTPGETFFDATQIKFYVATLDAADKAALEKLITDAEVRAFVGFDAIPKKEADVKAAPTAATPASAPASVPAPSLVQLTPAELAAMRFSSAVPAAATPRVETKSSDDVKTPQSEVKIQPAPSSVTFRSKDEKAFIRMTQTEVDTLPEIKGVKWAISDAKDVQEKKYRTISNGSNSFRAYIDHLTTTDECKETYVAMIKAYTQRYPDPDKLDCMVITPKSQALVDEWKAACVIAGISPDRVGPPAPPPTVTLRPDTPASDPAPTPRGP